MVLVWTKSTFKQMEAAEEVPSYFSGRVSYCPTKHSPSGTRIDSRSCCRKSCWICSLEGPCSCESLAILEATIRFLDNVPVRYEFERCLVSFSKSLPAFLLAGRIRARLEQFRTTSPLMHAQNPFWQDASFSAAETETQSCELLQGIGGSGTRNLRM